MSKKDMEYLLKSFSKVSGLGIRMYRNGKAEYYYSPVHLYPDPAIAIQNIILASSHDAGVITTTLFQHYGYINLSTGETIVIGPTVAYEEDEKDFEYLFFLLDIPVDQRLEYLQTLCCSPEITAQHIAWLLSFFITAISGRTFDVERVHIDTKYGKAGNEIDKEHTREILKSYDDTEQSEIALTSYRFERLLNLYISTGQVDNLIELFEALPKVEAGKMASDRLRQYKNMFICSATTMSRAAIDGGLDPQSAFKLSDLYIQKCEILRDPNVIMMLMKEMATDMVERVRTINYGEVQNFKIFEACYYYVKKNLYSRIQVSDMAKELGISRSYLSTMFHERTGKTISQFITDQKIVEARRLLQFTDKSIVDIAIHLGFSSQSHFQNIFKKQVGQTPLEYKRENAI
ncbi:AraC family transcriptional regulator [Anaerosporobacter sp.]|uniref:AraC family transcriptional regulator n=1 Tax=Anaerosporobacter sp. TaxID=1872529 RepID=UPI00286F01C0|nr:AraC family transcriptional regulator [Anaerosporobacter sp.]